MIRPPSERTELLGALYLLQKVEEHGRVPEWLLEEIYAFRKVVHEMNLHTPVKGPESVQLHLPHHIHNRAEPPDID